MMFDLIFNLSPTVLFAGVGTDDLDSGQNIRTSARTTASQAGSRCDRRDKTLPTSLTIIQEQKSRCTPPLPAIMQRSR